MRPVSHGRRSGHTCIAQGFAEYRHLKQRKDYRVGVIGVSDGWSSERLADALAERTGFRCLIDMRHLTLDLHSGRAMYHDVDLTTLDALVLKKIGTHYSWDMLDRLAMLRFVSSRGVRIFSEPARVKRALDRLSGTVTLRAAGIPMPPTTVTESVDMAVEAVAAYGRAVFKPVFTSKARGMSIIEAGPDAPERIRQFQAAGNPILYIQKMLRLPGQDLGLAFLGGEFLGCYARAGNSESWNTTTHFGGKYQPYQPGDDIRELARRAQSLFGLDFTCVDIAETEEGPVVFEVSAFGGFRGLLAACGIDAAAAYADYVLDRLSHAH